LQAKRPESFTAGLILVHKKRPQNMEVKVKEVDGSLPQGSYISVRVGDVQKQTQYNPEKLYRFPEARRYGKVDVYQRVGTCDISWSADEPETKLCKAMGVSGDTGIRLQVCMTRPVGKDLESIEVTTPVAAKKRQTAKWGTSQDLSQGSRSGDADDGSDEGFTQEDA